jgi:hypothetical protein
MQKNKFFIMTILLILTLALVTAASITKEEKSKINDCKKDCRETKKFESNNCKEAYNDCRGSCKLNYNTCVDNQKEIKEECKEDCTDSKCKSQCNKDYNLNKKELCAYTECKKECSTTRKECRSTVTSVYKDCKDSCPYVALDDNITCEGGYKPKETFAQGCEFCQCNYNGKITCEKTDYCQLPNAENIDETLCTNSGGLYQALCKGPYFGVACSNKYFCICEGDDQYTCPLEHSCVKDFIPPKIKESSIQGWRDLLGQPLGDIGVCAPNLEIESCGNEICEPTQLETDLTCPEDC